MGFQNNLVHLDETDLSRNLLSGSFLHQRQKHQLERQPGRVRDPHIGSVQGHLRNFRQFQNLLAQRVAIINHRPQISFQFQGLDLGVLGQVRPNLVGRSFDVLKSRAKNNGRRLAIVAHDPGDGIGYVVQRQIEIANFM